MVLRSQRSGRPSRLRSALPSDLATVPGMPLGACGRGQRGEESQREQREQSTEGDAGHEGQSHLLVWGRLLRQQQAAHATGGRGHSFDSPRLDLRPHSLSREVTAVICWPTRQPHTQSRGGTGTACPVDGPPTTPSRCTFALSPWEGEVSASAVGAARGPTFAGAGQGRRRRESGMRYTKFVGVVAGLSLLAGTAGVAVAARSVGGRAGRRRRSRSRSPSRWCRTATSRTGCAGTRTSTRSSPAARCTSSTTAAERGSAHVHGRRQEGPAEDGRAGRSTARSATSSARPTAPTRTATRRRSSSSSRTASARRPRRTSTGPATPASRARARRASRST